MKKIRFIIAVMMVSCLMAMSVCASEVMPADSSGAYTGVFLSIDSSGYADATVAYIGTADVTGTSFYVHLQRSTDGGSSWTTYMSWVVSGGSTANFDRGTTVASGYTYRVQLVTYVYSSNGNFNYTTNSNTVSY